MTNRPTKLTPKKVFELFIGGKSVHGIWFEYTDVLTTDELQAMLRSYIKRNLVKKKKGK